jgi:hypothetical protein
MTMSKQLARAVTDRDPYGWRAGTVRVLANALLVLLAFEVVSLVGGMAQVIVTGAPPPVTPVELVLLVVVFVLVRWIVVLPGLLLVLVGLEYVARRAPQARVLTAIVAFAPMVWWELTQSSGDTSAFSAVLGVTAVLFAVLARLPALRRLKEAERIDEVVERRQARRRERIRRKDVDQVETVFVDDGHLVDVVSPETHAILLARRHAIDDDVAPIR